MPVVGLVRHPQSAEELAWSLESQGGLAQSLQGRRVTCLIHAAWDMRGTREAREINEDGAATLFRGARDAGVRRIVFISTLSAFSGCRSLYGQSKLAAESLLHQIPGAVVFRLGLVFGASPGGMFGALQQQIRKSSVIPLIGRGLQPQYLLHEQTLAEAARGAIAGRFDPGLGKPITLAHPRGWPFRDLVKKIAASESRRVRLVPIPWQLLFTAARASEALGIRLPFRSDSIVSFVYQDPNPNFVPMQDYGIQPIAFGTCGNS